jgi:hypothetical protein
VAELGWEERMLRTVVAVVYLGVGLLVANSHHYLSIHDLKDLVSAIIAVLLWPLVLAGVDLHFGTLENDKGK